MEKNTVIDALHKLQETGKARKFVQSIDISFSFKGLDFKKPENRIDLEVGLPHPVDRKLKSVLFVKDKTFASEAQKLVDHIVIEDQIPQLTKKDAKRLAQKFDLFFAEGLAMITVGKHLGQVLSPRGKMPKPIPPNVKAFETLINRSKQTIKISNKRGKFMPVAHAMIGNEKMSEDHIAENFLAVYQAVLNQVDIQNIRNVFIKKTMSPPISLLETKQGVK